MFSLRRAISCEKLARSFELSLGDFPEAFVIADEDIEAVGGGGNVMSENTEEQGSQAVDNVANHGFTPG